MPHFDRVLGGQVVVADVRLLMFSAVAWRERSLVPRLARLQDTVQRAQPGRAAARADRRAHAARRARRELLVPPPPGGLRVVAERCQFRDVVDMAAARAMRDVLARRATVTGVAPTGRPQHARLKYTRPASASCDLVEEYSEPCDAVVFLQRSSMWPIPRRFCALPRDPAAGRDRLRLQPTCSRAPPGAESRTTLAPEGVPRRRVQGPLRERLRRCRTARPVPRARAAAHELALRAAGIACTTRSGSPIPSTTASRPPSPPGDSRFGRVRSSARSIS